MSYGKITLIQTNPQLNELFTEYLKNAGLNVASFLQVDAFSINSARSADLIAVEVGSQHSDAEMLFRKLRTDSAVPLIAIRSRGTPCSAEALINAGASQVLSLPLSAQELVQAVTAQLDSLHAPQLSPSKPQYSFRGLCADISTCTVTLCGEELSLSEKEVRILHLLMSQQNHVFSHEQLFAYAWGNVNVRSPVLSVHINNLRKKLGSYGGHIRAVRPDGYMFQK